MRVEGRWVRWRVVWVVVLSVQPSERIAFFSRAAASAESALRGREVSFCECEMKSWLPARSSEVHASSYSFS